MSPVEAAPDARLKWAVLAVVLAADVLDLLDATITNIAAPTITEDLHGGEVLVQWLGTGYSLALGVLLVTGGRLGDRFGRRRVFLIDADLFGLGWRSMFLVNIVAGGVAVVGAFRVLPRDDGDGDAAVDGLGSALLGLSVIGLLYGLIDGSGHGWSARPVLYLAGGALFFVLFCRRQTSAAEPLIKPSLLRNRGFTSGLFLGIVFFAAVSGLLYVLSLFMQHGLGYSPTKAAFGLAPIAAGIVIASIAGHHLIGGLGRNLIFIGLIITLAGTGWMLALVHASGTDVAPWALVPPILLMGLGMGTCFGTVYDVTIGDIDQQEADSAGGSLGAVQQVANAIGAAVVTTVYFHADGQVPAMRSSLEVSVRSCRGSPSRSSVPTTTPVGAPRPASPSPPASSPSTAGPGGPGTRW
ncbi:MFS transporter [Actinacidiphila paucisporea]|uniref:Predicted arabinose efflux permease, MFS family n=1 Tax=Actinacidiphila paucisporea TaxID=310782 RepID=A0A1M7ICW4_9ACTN|nr:MFS transporter [Actinacidiphila paucisporea]SHM38594.1 Predicted arabinose efflux permease, MFS family [Actinacidiphila paucisporea]